MDIQNTENTQHTIPCSSPTASLIEVPARDVYSFAPADTLYNTHVVDDDHGNDNDHGDSDLLEVSQNEFLQSQKQKLVSSPSQLEEIHSAQSPLKHSQPIFTSSPVPINNDIPPNSIKNIDSIAPSAQLTSFRLQSPAKIKTPHKSDLLVTQESFTVPNLISPVRSSLPTTPTTVNESPSVYCTASQKQLRTQTPSHSLSHKLSPLKSSPVEIKRSKIEYRGDVRTKSSSPFGNIQTRVITDTKSRPNSKRTIHEIADSEDENDQDDNDEEEKEVEIIGSGSSDDEDDPNISIIEITRTVKKRKVKESVIQVVSSPGFESFGNSSPIKAGQKPVEETFKASNLELNFEADADDADAQAEVDIEADEDDIVYKNNSLDDDIDFNNIYNEELNNNDDDNDNETNNKENNNDDNEIQATQNTQDQDEFSLMSMDQLRTKIIQYGLKPAKSKLKMIESLKAVSKHLTQSSILKLSQTQDFKISQQLIKDDIFNNIDNVISNNTKLIEKVLSFEPIPWIDLVNCLQDNEVEVTTEFLKDWCDRNSICVLDQPTK